MYVLGHSAFAYILIATGYLVSSKKFRPEAVLFVLVFSNILDALHIGFLRTLIHNLIGTALFTAFWIFFFHRYRLIDTKHVPLLLFAVGTHVLADYLFSGYSFFFPLEHTAFQVYAFNSFENLFVESILGIAFAILFFAMSSYAGLKEFIAGERRKFVENFSWRRVYNPDLFNFYVFGAFFLFSVAQLPIFITGNLERLLDLVWFAWLFLFVLVLFLLVLGIVGFAGRADKNQGDSITFK